MIRRPPRSTLSSSSAASDVYKRQVSTQSTGVPALTMSTGVALTKPEMRSLYRALLKSALTFPSKRRESIVMDIRSQFRVHSGEKDPAAIKEMTQEAEHALFELGRFAKGGKDGNWSYTQVS
eukprot:TRINITY_DN5565_c0_g1_i2.p1 TRINITY_DN5565_c0_g1~~TRINITY_DN5565_c0_g1_i2.p1  ORF type:complete len:122 (+),score=35.58 TRINITY_DN5565_c0_g1_i2:95-460(+)